MLSNFVKSTATAVAVLSLVPACSAVLLCSDTVSTTVNDNIECAGNCVLDGATVNGNVECSTGTLVIDGGSTVTGVVTIKNAVTSVTIDDATVLGSVKVEDAPSLQQFEIKQAASLGSVTVNNTPANVVAAGQLANLHLSGTSGDLIADNLVATSSVSVTKGTGNINICSSSLGGGLSVLEHEGNIKIDASEPNCGSTTISANGGFNAEKGTGDITVNGADLSTGDFLVKEYNGDILLQGADLGDLAISASEGSLDLVGLTVDSDISITSHVGDVLVDDITSLGDTIISSVDGNVEVVNTDAGLEVVTVSLVSGTVTIEGNINLNIVVTESSGLVTISGNTVTVGSVTKNTGGVTLTNNTFESLTCSDNTPAPTGSGNTVTFPDGQCSTGFP